MRTPLQAAALLWVGGALVWGFVEPSLWAVGNMALALVYVILGALQAVVGWPFNAPSREERADLLAVRTTLDLDSELPSHRGEDSVRGGRGDEAGAV